MPTPLVIQPARYASSGSRRYASPYPQSVQALRKFAQGAGSALLVFTGAGTMTNNAAASAPSSPASYDFTSLEGLSQALMSGGIGGPLQIAAAAFLFLAAGRCVSRFLGLVVVAVFLVLYMQGVTLDDTVMFFERFAGRLGAATDAFMTAEVS